jgi:hypothetical protein
MDDDTLITVTLGERNLDVIRTWEDGLRKAQEALDRAVLEVSARIEADLKPEGLELGPEGDAKFADAAAQVAERVTKLGKQMWDTVDGFRNTTVKAITDEPAPPAERASDSRDASASTPMDPSTGSAEKSAAHSEPSTAGTAGTGNSAIMAVLDPGVADAGVADAGAAGGADAGNAGAAGGSMDAGGGGFGGGMGDGGGFG